jgi:hypothetical protein
MSGIKKIGDELKKAMEGVTVEELDAPKQKTTKIPNDPVTKEVTGKETVDVPEETGIQPAEPQIVEPKPVDKKVGKDSIDELTKSKAETVKPEIGQQRIESVNVDDYVPDLSPRSGRIQEILDTHTPLLAARSKVYEADLSIDPEYLLEEPIHINPRTFEGNDIVDTLAKTAEMNRDSIMKSRRGNEDGVLTDKMLKSLATDLGVKGKEQLESWKSRIPGEAFNAETILLMKSYLTQSALKLKKLSSKVALGKDVSDEDRLAFSKAYAEHIQVQDSFMGVRAEAGRALRALGLKDDIAMDLKDTIAHIRSGMSIERVAEAIHHANTVEGVSEAVEATRPGALQKVGNALHEMWINSILSGIKTQIVNTTGSALNLGMHKVDLAVGSMMGRNPFGDAKMNEADYIAMDEVLAKGFSSIASMQEAFHVAMKVVKTADQYRGATGQDGSSKLEVQSQAISSQAFGVDQESPVGRILDMFGTFIRVPTERVMGGADGFFRVMAEKQSIYEQAFRQARQAERDGLLEGKDVQEYMQELINSPTEQMRKESTEFAQRIVFQQDSELASKFIALVSAIPTGRWIVPFIRTPLNLVSQAFAERSPLGLLAPRIRQDLVAGGARGQLARSRMVTGSIIAASFYSLAHSGQITGSEPQDKARRDAWRQAGIKARSVKFENADGTVSYISYDRLEPFSFLFSAAADIAALQHDLNVRAEYRDEELEWDKMATGFIIAITNGILDKTFMTGIQDAMEALRSCGWYLERAF